MTLSSPTSTVYETERLIICKLTLDDAGFMLRLLNSPDWLAYIGDRNVYNLQDARAYLENGSLAHYQKHGFGFWGVRLKSDLSIIGSCGFMVRDYLPHTDIGFAFLPEYLGKGYGYESAAAALQYADTHLDIDNICAITSPDNTASKGLLTKLGLKHDTYVNTPTGDKVCLFLQA